MATGSLWNLDNPLKPWALFDTNAILEIPFELEDWLASLGAGFVDAIVGGGGLILVPSLFALFPQAPPATPGAS